MENMLNCVRKLWVHIHIFLREHPKVDPIVNLKQQVENEWMNECTNTIVGSVSIHPSMYNYNYNRMNRSALAHTHSLRGKGKGRAERQHVGRDSPPDRPVDHASPTRSRCEPIFMEKPKWWRGRPCLPAWLRSWTDTLVAPRDPKTGTALPRTQVSNADSASLHPWMDG